MKPRRLLLAFAIGLGLTLLLLMALNPSPDTARASPSILYASLTCGPPIPDPCYTAIQAAVNAAHDGDTIRVIQGTYSETVVLTKSLTLEGGWRKDMLGRDWDIYTTTIDAHRSGSAIRMKGNVSPTIEGFIITGGDASSYLGWGGGILADGEWGEGGMIIIRHNVIVNNIACSSPVSCQGYGGGIMVYSNRSIIEYNKVISNLASVDGYLGGHGGGIAIWGYPGSSTVAHNVIVSNTALFSQTAVFADGQGGGSWSEHDVTLIDNEIWGNVAAVKGEGRGGGVYAGGTLYDNRILRNTASISGTGYGGGVCAYYVSDFSDNVVQGNVASKSSDGTGGGVYANYLKDAHRNTIVGNVATRGGGVYFAEYTGNQEFTDNRLTDNRATGTNLSTWDGGGGIASQADRVAISRNDILSNTAIVFGGGLLVTGGKQYSIQGNTLEDNSADYGGGIFVYSSTGTLAGNWIMSNTSHTRGGGLYVYQYVTATLDANRILSNTSLGEGGGIAIRLSSYAVTLTNHIIAHNSAAHDGGGVYILGSLRVRLINNTLVDNQQGNGKEGVALLSGSMISMTNNVIVGHGVAITVAAGCSATLSHNDYWDNGIHVSGQLSGTTDMTLDPQFENRTASDYHLGLASPIIDKGDNSINVPYDFDGDPRPRGSGIDIGADEAYRSESYVSQATGSDLTGNGAPGNPFATVTKGISETRTGGTVYVGRGHYTERITITRSVNLLGGYRESDWTRSITIYGTTLDAARTGTVVTVQGENVWATVEGFTITGGEASMYGLGGGLAIYDNAAATIRYNTITGNHAQNGGGGILLWGNANIASVVDSNRIYNNVADGMFVPLSGALSPQSPQQGPEPGGGLMVAGSARVVNNWIYSNTSGLGGDGMALLGGEGLVQVYHNTVADNGGSSGEGVWLGGNEIIVYNNLIVGHGVGISATTTTQAIWDYNGFYDNVAAYAPGLTSGPHDVNSNPRFINRAARDYHIDFASPMADAGKDVDVTTDIDGDSRPAPAGTRADVGADEISQRRIYLPIILRD